MMEMLDAKMEIGKPIRTIQSVSFSVSMPVLLVATDVFNTLTTCHPGPEDAHNGKRSFLFSYFS